MSGIRADQMTPGQRPRQAVWTPVFLAFLAYAFVILTYRVPIGTAVMSAALMGLILQRQSVRVPPFLWLYAAFLAWAAVGQVTTAYPEAVSFFLGEQIKVLLVALVAVNALRTGIQIRHFMIFVLVSYLLFPARSTLVNYFVTGNTLFGRAIGPFIYSNPNDLAALTILMLGPALALWASAPRGSLARWVGLAGAAPLVVVIVLTQSRGGFLALVSIALPSVVALARRRPRAAVAFAVLLVVGLYLAPASFWKRMQGLGKGTSVATIREMDPEGSAGQRFAVLRTALRIVQDHPVLGIGLGAYGLANAHYNPALGDLDTHNTYLNLLAENGFPGLILFLALLISVLRSVRDARRRAQRAFPAQAEMLRWLQFGLIGFLIAAVFGSQSKLALFYVYLALLWSTAQAVRSQSLSASPAAPPAFQPHGTTTVGERFHDGGDLRSRPA
jgi:O-antigen ligase